MTAMTALVIFFVAVVLLFFFLAFLFFIDVSRDRKLNDKARKKELRDWDEE
jgi:hypothetical protein